MFRVEIVHYYAVRQMYEVVNLVVKVPPPAGLFFTSTVDAKTVATRITIRPAFPYIFKIR